MDRIAAERLATALMAEFGLHDAGWTFAWNRHKAAFGVCRHHRLRIELSGPLTEVNTASLVEDTIRHEIAHALAGIGTGHGEAWRRMCAVTGATPRARCDGTPVAARWHGRCPDPECGLVLTRHRLTAAARRGACPRCCRDAGGYDARFRLVWTDARRDQLASEH